MSFSDRQMVKFKLGDGWVYNTINHAGIRVMAAAWAAPWLWIEVNWREEVDKQAAHSHFHSPVLLLQAHGHKRVLFAELAVSLLEAEALQVLRESVYQVMAWYARKVMAEPTRHLFNLPPGLKQLYWFS